MAKKEFRRGSIRRVLSRIRGSDQGPQFELFRDYTDVFECSKWVRATSGSSSNLFVWWWWWWSQSRSRFFWAGFWTTESEFATQKQEKVSQKCGSHPYWGLELIQSWSRLKFGLPAGHFPEPSCKRNLTCDFMAHNLCTRLYGTQE